MMRKNLIKLAKIYAISALLFLIPLTGCIKSGEKQQSPPPFIINGRVVYCDQTYTLLPPHLPAYIVGAIIENKTSLIYVWYPKNKSIDIKIAYTPPKDVIPIYQQVLSLNITTSTGEKVASGREIIPFNFKYDEKRKGWMFEYNIRNSLHHPEERMFADGGAIYYPSNQTIILEWEVR